MSVTTKYCWINKTGKSPYLSNCKDDKAVSSRIRSHILLGSHEAKRQNNRIKQQRRLLPWSRRTASPLCKIPQNVSSATSQQRKSGFPYDRPGKCNQEDRSPVTPHTSEPSHVRRQTVDDFGTDLPLDFCKPSPRHRLSGAVAPFSAFAIDLNTAALRILDYCENIWSKFAFRFLGCIGYDHIPITRCEFTTLMQACLTNAAHGYSLLAAAAARLEFFEAHYHRPRNSRLAHIYARQAIHGVKQQLHGRLPKCEGRNAALSEQEATDIILLATYEIYCVDEKAATMHLEAVRKLYKCQFANTFMQRLQANLELLAVRGVANTFSQMVSEGVYPR